MVTAIEIRAQVRDPRDYVTREVWDWQIQLLMRDHPVDEVMPTGCSGPRSRT
ncbi:hypothetical protein [Streptomyces paromomycinus]|uniref:Uncharacterized protein n=1 Tax=Streptomyces paromomycinus TaxID=92743 RepID=A0A401W9K9_STREY|nr:hypothetical protein [Streptomyces paromomycinus]GCD46003.1 hypothetical protein GKJPGBOP_05749 [Streptomyces paromomycinus]